MPVKSPQDFGVMVPSLLNNFLKHAMQLLVFVLKENTACNSKSFIFTAFNPVYWSIQNQKMVS